MRKDFGGAGLGEESVNIPLVYRLYGILEIGIAGEVLHTPGHSDDSVSLLLDNGAAFTGDLPPLEFVGMEDPQVVASSWELLRERGATHVHPAHGPIRPMT